jgi:hypothetical protein
MIPLLTRHAIQVLIDAEHTQVDIAQRTSVSVATVRRIAAETDVDDADDAALRKSRHVGRPSKAAPFADKVRGWLAEDAELPTQELLRRAKEAGYGGNRTAFYALVAGLRPPRAAPVVRFEGLPGEFSQHDFGEVDVHFVSGRHKRVRFFASRLKYSRFVAVTGGAAALETVDWVARHHAPIAAICPLRRGNGRRRCGPAGAPRPKRNARASRPAVSRGRPPGPP